MASNEETCGWQVGKSLTDCLRHMLDNHVACDVTFLVQSKGNSYIKMPAHKLMLHARSSVFEAMFSGASGETDGNVVITDMEPEPFKDLLRYMYTDEIALTAENVLPLLYAAEKYLLDNLAIKCRKFLTDEISADNVCLILTHSLIQHEEKLVNACLDLIAPNVKAVLETEAFYKMSHDALLKVVRCDQLAHGVEAELFEACIEWGKRKVPDPDNATDQEIRDILGTECLHKIRFPYVPYKDFAMKFGHSSVLTAEEKSLIYPLLATQEESYSNSLSDLGFDVASRMVKRTRYVNDRKTTHIVDVSGENSEEFTFSVNKPVQLMGFSIHGGPEGSAHDVKITVHETTVDGTPCTETKQTITTKGNNQPIPVYFRKTRIVDDRVYRVCVTVKGTEHTGYSWKPISISRESSVTFSSNFIKHPFLRTPEIGGGYVAEFLYQYVPSPSPSDAWLSFELPSL